MIVAFLGILSVIVVIIVAELAGSDATGRLADRLGARALGIVTLGRFPKTRDGTLAGVVPFLTGLAMLVVGGVCLLVVVAALWPG